MTRLERWTDEQPSTNGFALLLTNDERLWETPPTTNPGDAGVGGTLRWLGWTITSRAPGAV